MPFHHNERLSFQPFDEWGEVRIYYNGFLPHWRQDGCTYFVTFRLADSVPEGVLEAWRCEREQWLRTRDIEVNDDNWIGTFRRLSRNDRKLFERYFVSKLFQTLDEAHGSCVLRDNQLAEIVMKALLHFHTERLECGDAVVMPNHVHALMTPYPGYELEDVLHSIKSYTSNQIHARLKTKGTLWMSETHDHIVRDGEELLRIQNYIRVNPDKARLPDGQYLLHTAEYDLQL
ncbi:Transposase IS200 like protein [Novipirellula aureliae]|uniref:Transposase IS200 like protein n=1 Tax=Novipirellula aureliae TaxID=2527966 RepID=A0A5C6EBF9_9BACT|nr:transposase [Novipirellula aureliae]TWU45815.1 Transposase IS200 like protein [Novipirellula aureliae]